MNDLSEDSLDISAKPETANDNSIEWDVFANAGNAQQLSQAWLELLVQ